MKKETEQKIKAGFINIITFLVLLTGTLSFLDEFFRIRDKVSLFFLSFAIVFLIIFIWKRIIKRILDKWTMN